MRAQWPEQRVSPLIAPPLDAVSGRSYNQASQTPGTLGGRRSVETWYADGVVSTPSRKIIKTVGGVWRLIGVSARVRIAPTSSTISVDVLVQVPGASSYVSIFDTVPSIGVGEKEATGGVISASKSLIPVGTLVSIDSGADAVAEDLTTELHYRTQVVAQ